MIIGEISPEQLLGNLNTVTRKNAPKTLYVAGDLSLIKMPKVAIIGTRHPELDAQTLAADIVAKLVSKKICIVSGLAAGIDTIAHRTALSCGGKTIAVLGTPLDQVYPQSNAALQRQIAAQHLAISQFAPGTVITKGNFPARNRTMALVADATVIIDAGEKSGTVHQGMEAIRIGRPLFVSSLLAARKWTWVEKLLCYGAEVLGSDLEPLLEMVPSAAVTP